MRHKMIFLSSTFPFGKGEKTFIEPELEALIHEYDITLISHADAGDVADTENESLVDAKISVLHFESHITFLQKICWGLRFFLDREGRQELTCICKSGGSVFKRLYQSVGFYILTMEELKYIKRENLFRADENVICYSYWYTYYCYAFLKLKKQFPNLKVITRTHGVDLYHERMSGGRQPFKQIMDKELDGVIFAANYAKEYYRKQFAHDKKDGKYIVCKLGVPQPDRKDHAKGEFCLLSCSYTIPLKRIRLIIQALSIINEEYIHWIHIGDGEELEQLVAYAKEKLAGKNNITYEFMGYLNGSQIQKIYQEKKIDAFITTSSTEGGCPVSIQEAMSYGVPIIGTDVGGITEMICGNGYLLPANPEKEIIAETIKKVYNLEESEIERLRQNSFDAWYKDYNITNNLKKLVAAIHYLEGSKI